jgi:hypothetical protein
LGIKTGGLIATKRSYTPALVTILNERQIRYAIIGGLAVLQHTRARTTADDARRGWFENCVIEASRLQG